MTDFGYFPQATIKYKTYIKTATVQALSSVFDNHKDSLLARTHCVIEYPRTRADYPGVIIRFFEREVMNAGVGHEEMLELEDSNGLKASYVFKHYFYKGDVEFDVVALSSLDRDLIADTIVQIIGMGDLEEYTNRFFARIYTDSASFPDALNHFINFDTDRITGMGEVQKPVPWQSEDDLIYGVTLRVQVFGEFYSPPPNAPAGFIEEVLQYPYIGGQEDVPEGTAGDQTEWLP